jgi:ankyrin repeat protein
MRKDHQALQDLLSEFPIDLTEMRYLGGWSLLHFATSASDPVAADLLLRFGIDANIQTEEMKRTALHEAVLGNKVELVELLVGWGADPNLTDADRNSAMHFAVDYSYCEVVKSLLASSHIVDLGLRNNANMTPFNTCRNPEIFEILIAYSNQAEKAASEQSKQTASSHHRTRNTYESRLIVRNSEIVHHNSRVDMVEKFLSLREQPERKTFANFLKDNESIISEESYEDSLKGSTATSNALLTPKKGNKLKRIGSTLRSTSMKSSFRIASQNIGLMR